MIKYLPLLFLLSCTDPIDPVCSPVGIYENAYLRKVITKDSIITTAFQQYCPGKDNAILSGPYTMEGDRLMYGFTSFTFDCDYLYGIDKYARVANYRDFE